GGSGGGVGLHAERVERRAPASVVVLGQLQVVALAMHAHGNAPDPRPRVEPRAQCPERTVVGGHGAPGEADRRTEKLPALVEHGYSMTCSARSRSDCGMVRPRAFAVLRLITSSNFVGCSTGRSAGLAPRRILAT